MLLVAGTEALVGMAEASRWDDKRPVVSPRVILHSLHRHVLFLNSRRCTLCYNYLVPDRPLDRSCLGQYCLVLFTRSPHSVEPVPRCLARVHVHLGGEIGMSIGAKSETKLGRIVTRPGHDTVPGALNITNATAREDGLEVAAEVRLMTTTKTRKSRRKSESSFLVTSIEGA